MTDPLSEILRREHFRLTHAVARLFDTCSRKRPEADLTNLLTTASELRQSITDFLTDHANQFGAQELIHLQSSLHAVLDQQIGAAISKLFEQRTKALTDQAERDPLTQLPNRRAFERRVGEEVSRARRYQRELSLVFFDVDGFKSVNDRLGHLAGDRVLADVARILQSSLRQSDAVFRYGGDEFVALCPETSNQAMENVLRRLETSLCAHNAETNFDPAISVSWGIACFPTNAANAEDLLRLADERLYVCKKEHYKLAAGHR